MHASNTWAFFGVSNSRWNYIVFFLVVFAKECNGGWSSKAGLDTDTDATGGFQVAREEGEGQNPFVSPKQQQQWRYQHKTEQQHQNVQMKTTRDHRQQPGSFWTRPINSSTKLPSAHDPLPRLYQIDSISSGNDHTCVVLSDDGGMRCWGSGFYGQLGAGHSANIGDDATEMGANIPKVDYGDPRPPKQIALGAAHTCIIDQDEHVKCWGWGVCGQTGYEHTETLGDDMLEIADAMTEVNLGDRKAVRLALGETHTCAILDDGTVRCWGCNDERQLGVSGINVSDTNAYQMSQGLTKIELRSKSKPVEVGAGATYTCIRMDDGSVECVGTFGRHSVNRDAFATSHMVNLPRPALQLVSGRYFACAVISDSSLYCWGQAFSKEFPGGKRMEMIAGDKIKSYRVHLEGRVQHASAGDFHICASTGNVTHKCWGWNAYDQLGFKLNAEPKAISSDVPNLPGIFPGLKIKAYALGSAHTCAIVGSRRQAVRCIGMGLAGQKADGSKEFQLDGSSPLASLIRFDRPLMPKEQLPPPKPTHSTMTRHPTCNLENMNTSFNFSTNATVSNTSTILGDKKSKVKNIKLESKSIVDIFRAPSSTTMP